MTWSHYIELLRIDEEDKLHFYEHECIQQNWSVRELKRQKEAFLFERSLDHKKENNKYQLVNTSRMQDKINELAEELRKHKNFRILHRHIAKILLKKGIVSDTSKVKSGYMHKNTSDCSFLCSVKAEDNSFGKPLGILVKGDHDSEKRCLRIIIQVGTDFCMKREEDDKPGIRAVKAFKREIADAERDIKAFFEGKLKCD